MVVIPRTVPEIHVFWFTISETNSSVEDICSVGIPRGFYNLVRPMPPSTARYALGVLGVIEFMPDTHFISRGEGESTHFALRIDLPEAERDPPSGNQGSVTLQRMHLDPAVNVLEETAVVRFFDCFSGKIWFIAYSEDNESDLVVDYLSLY